MKKHYFLGLAAKYSKAERVRQRREQGTHQDLLNLYDFLFEEYEAKQVVVTRNGRSAIAAVLEYLHLFHAVPPNKNEVIVNGFTCYAVVQGVEAAKCKPVYADIERETLNFSVQTLEKAVSEKTWAIIVQNTFGNMVEMREIEKFAKKHHLVIIEDLAHCVGRHYPDGREAGTVGEAAVLSFGKEKSIDVVNGGAAMLRDPGMFLVPVPTAPAPKSEERRARWYPTLAAICRGLTYVHLSGVAMKMFLKLGWITRSADGEIDIDDRQLSDWQAKLALLQLQKKDRLGARPLREFYLVRDRAEVLMKLRKAGYYFDGFWYETPVAPERYYKKSHFVEKNCPVATEVAKQIINFPTWYNSRDLEKARKIVEDYIL